MTSKRILLFAALCCAPSFVQSAQAAPDEPVATVDGVPVTHAILDQSLEGIYGDQLLPTLIDNQLLTNALTAKGQSVSDEEVEAELAQIELQEPTLKIAIDAGGARTQVIKNQVRRNLVVRKLLIARIAEPTPDQLQKFYTTYASYYGTPVQNRLAFLTTSTKARADQLVHALHVNAGSFNTLVKQQKDKAASDPIASQSTEDVGSFETPDEFATSRGIPPQLVTATVKALATAKKGQILPLQALAPTGPFLIVKIMDHKDATHPPLAQLQSQVVIDYKLAQVASDEIKKLPQNPQNLAENIKQVVAFMAQPNPQTGEPGTKATLRDALTYILHSATTNTLNYLRTHSSVTISDPSYSNLASQYQKQP